MKLKRGEGHSLKRLLSILLICSFLVTPCLTVLANNSVSETAPASSKTETTGASRNIVVVYQGSSKKQEKKSTDLVESENNFEEGGYKPSKWEITKYLAKWFGITFVNDVKSYVILYPLFKVSQLISYLALYFPTYGFFKITGIDIPAKISRVFNKSENMNIIGQNLYNVIPLTLSSFMFKWGRDLYFYLKSI